MMTSFRAALLALGSLGLASSASAATQPAGAGQHGQTFPCFFVRQWVGWKAPDPHTVYLGVSFHQIYRAHLSSGSSLLQYPEARLIFRDHGDASVCNPLDLHLEVNIPGETGEPLIVDSVVKLTPAEVKALPPGDVPYS
jgi:hypothetical protein